MDSNLSGGRCLTCTDPNCFLCSDTDPETCY